MFSIKRNITGLLRVKNEERWLPYLLKQLENICDNILVIDDGSTDESLEILKSFNKVKVISQYDKPFHGGRDWIHLHKWANDFHPTWIIAIDADCAFEDNSEYRILELLDNSDEFVDAWKFPYFYMWENKMQYRNDYHYKNKELIAIYRYNNNQLPRNVIAHSTPIPKEILKNGLIRKCDDIRIKHFGYMYEEDRNFKYNFYTKRDKNPIKCGAGDINYEHIKSIPKKNNIKNWIDWERTQKVCISSDKWYPSGYYHIAYNSNKDNLGTLLKLGGNINYTPNVPYSNIYKFKDNSIDELLISMSSILYNENILIDAIKYLKHWSILEIRCSDDYKKLKNKLEKIGYVCIEKIKRNNKNLITCRLNKK